MDRNRKLHATLMNIIVISVYFIFSYIMIFPLYKTGRVAMVSDFSFHAARLEEIFNNLKQGELFTYIATSTFQHTGVGSFLFYPTLFLYPWAMLRFLVNPINAFYIWYWLVTFFTFIICFLCMTSFSKSRLQAFIFSFVYVLIPYRLYLGTSVFGEFIASMFLPIVFLGVYNIFYGDYKKWYILSLGMALLGYSHVLSVLMTCEIIGIILVVLLIFKKISMKRMMYLGIAACVTLLLVLPVVYPFITDFVGKGITSALPGISPPLLMQASTIFSDSISNKVGACSIGTLLLVVLFFGWRFENKAYKFIYCLGVLSVIIATSLIPWISISSSFLGMVQLPFRYLMYAGLFLAVVGSRKITSYIVEKIDFRVETLYKKILVFVAIFFVGVVSYFGSNENSISKVRSFNQELYLRITDAKETPTIPSEIQLDKNNYQNQFGYSVLYGETDYYPKVAIDNPEKSKSIVNNIAYIGNKKIKVNPISKPNKLIYNVHIGTKERVDLPVIAYSNTFVKVDGKNVKFNISDRGTVAIILSKGMHKIEVGYAPAKHYVIMIVCSIAVAVILSIYLLMLKFNKLSI